HRAFAFHGRNGQINLLKEKRSRGSEGYWYAYQRHAVGMVKRYAGRSAQLSMERLEEIAARLSSEDEAHSTPATVTQIGQVSALLTAHRRGGTKQAAIRFTNDDFEPLLMPKLQLPRLQKSLLPREHLLVLLDMGLDRKVTLISGPAGYGKTTLVSQWIAERGVRTDFPRVA